MNPSILYLMCMACLGLLPLYGQSSEPPSSSVDSLLEVVEALPVDTAARLQAYSKLATYYQSISPDTAVYFAQQGLALAQAGQRESPESQRRIAEAEWSLGTAYFSQGDIARAATAYENSIAIYKRYPDRLELSPSIVNSLGLAYAYLGETEKALATYQEAYELAIQLPDTNEMASITGRMGFTYQNMGQADSAFTYYERSLGLYRSLGNAERIAIQSSNLGAASADLGNYRQGIKYYEQALEVCQETDNRPQMVYCYMGIGFGYRQLLDYEQAVINYQQGLKVARALQDTQMVAWLLSDIGQIHHYQEDYELALEYLLEAKALVRADIFTENQDRRAIILGALSWTYCDMGEGEKALENGQQALEVFKQAGLRRREGAAWLAIGNAYLLLEDRAAAREAYLEALALNQEFYEVYSLVSALRSLAELAWSEGRVTEARSYAQRGLAVAEENDLLLEISLLSHQLWKCHKALNNPAQALAMYELHIQMRDSLNREENQRAVIRLEYQQQAFQDSLAFVQQQADTELAYQAQLSQRNLLLTGAAIVLLLGALGFLYFRYRQQQRNRARELELARERERKEQLAELDQLKSRFFANISHELRTPLTLILGQNQSLQAELDDPRIDPKFDMVDRNGRRLLELVNQVLDLSKLESGRLELNVQTFDLLPFLKNLLFSFESLADQKRQQLQFQSREESLLMVADPEKLERVFFNLLSNAVKFTPEGGRITLKLQMVAHRVHVGVLDTGVGIPAEQQAAIFDRFYQSESGANHPSPGTGIGLALVKELVELHEGSVELRSEPGQGSEFWVNLPLNAGIASETPATYEPRLEPLEAAVALPAAPTTSGKSRITHAESRILIVEDNSDVRSFLRQELLGMGYAVLEAEDGQTGLDKAKAEQPDLIISDVMMPKMDGFELAQAIRADANSSHVPLILLTAKGSEESRITGLQTGVDDYLTKPFNPRELQARVANLIAQRKRLREQFAGSLTIKPEEVSAVPMDQQFLQQVTATIEAHFTDEQFGVEVLAEAAGMSATHLNRKLKALIGQTAGKLIRSMRLQRAADLLRQDAANVSDIGYELCFSDPTNFTRAFKAQFGVTPSQYREQNAGAAAPE